MKSLTKEYTEILEFVNRFREMERDILAPTQGLWIERGFVITPCEKCACPTMRYPCHTCGYFPIYPEDALSDLYINENLITFEYYRDNIIGEHKNIPAFYLYQLTRRNRYREELYYKIGVDMLIKSIAESEDVPALKDIWVAVHDNKERFP